MCNCIFGLCQIFDIIFSYIPIIKPKNIQYLELWNTSTAYKPMLPELIMNPSINRILTDKLFQDDLDRLVSFCSSKYLRINIEKCKHIIFPKNRDLLKNHFYLNDEIVERAYWKSWKCFWFKIFWVHVDHIVAKSFKLLY